MDIAAGTYRSNSDDSEPCLWHRLSGFNGVDNWIGYRIGRSQTVTIAPTDAGFDATRCGTWTTAPTTGPQATRFGDGAWIVGVDIAAGIYRSTGADPDLCRWGRLSGFNGGDDLIWNGTSEDQVVKILLADTGFFTDRCGTWTLVSA